MMSCINLIYVFSATLLTEKGLKDEIDIGNDDASGKKIRDTIEHRNVDITLLVIMCSEG